MKFVPTGDKHTDFDFFDDVRPDQDAGKPWRTPSYLDTARKQTASKKK